MHQEVEGKFVICQLFNIWARLATRKFQMKVAGTDKSSLPPEPRGPATTGQEI
jgi:hypothetical protein